MSLSTTIVAYLILFTVAGFGFVLVNLLLGSILRPKNPHAEKLEIYECGEPTIGSSFVQFDLRFYVVALLFIIFEVEVAFFFPWAVVFGKSTQIARPDTPAIVEMEDGTRAIGPGYAGLVTELGLPVEEADLLATENVAATNAQARNAASKLVWTCVADIMVFFAVLMVGFAYVWKRGDLDWVRSMAGHSHTRTKSKSSWRDSTQVVTTT
ncbi:NADH-quinone oxidoreductase subunit A [Bremerella alba]|uniref:NADH-quinone oxidoreductase subunit n=1 Tax=Bremerella alba TaxID=980252 RepID=A0A7V9A994_9BACT|nr:NADH-quinone oxidoreductase subunit A [Bremerella alba]MBA2117113.1 NAD(P)H-quinone oxidoreductase subunit 3, chloroplastic [Bremerella alba]